MGEREIHALRRKAYWKKRRGGRGRDCCGWLVLPLRNMVTFGSDLQLRAVSGSVTLLQLGSVFMSITPVTIGGHEDARLSVATWGHPSFQFPCLPWEYLSGQQSDKITLNKVRARGWQIGQLRFHAWLHPRWLSGECLCTLVTTGTYLLILVSKGHTDTGAVTIWMACVAIWCHGDIQPWLMLRIVSGSVVLLQPRSVLMSTAPMLPPNSKQMPRV